MIDFAGGIVMFVVAVVLYCTGVMGGKPVPRREGNPHA